MPVFVYGHFDPLLIGFWVGLQLGWDPERAAEKHTHHEEREHMEAMNGIPPQIPGYTFAQKLGSGSEANVYLYQQLSPADK